MKGSGHRVSNFSSVTREQMNGKSLYIVLIVDSKNVVVLLLKKRKKEEDEKHFASAVQFRLIFGVLFIYFRHFFS